MHNLTKLKIEEFKKQYISERDAELNRHLENANSRGMYGSSYCITNFLEIGNKNITRLINNLFAAEKTALSHEHSPPSENHFSELRNEISELSDGECNIIRVKAIERFGNAGRQYDDIIMTTNRYISEMRESIGRRVEILKEELRLVNKPRDSAQLPTHQFISPETPFSNIKRLQEIIKSLKGTGYWIDKHFDKKAFEILADSLDASKISNFIIISCDQNKKTQSAVNEFSRLKAELQNKGINIEWKIIVDQNICSSFHDRWLCDSSNAWNIPPVNTIFKGQESEILRTSYRPDISKFLLKLRGLDLVQTAQDMQARGERFDLVKFRKWLEERGIHVPRGAVHMSSMRLWLEKAGVITSQDWQIDLSILEALIGVKASEVDALAMLTVEQKAYLKTLSNIPPKDFYPANKIEKLAAQLYGVKYNEKMLPKQILYPLQDMGYIKITKPTGGRGAKPFLVKPTEKFKKELITPLLETLEKQAASDLRPLLRKPLEDILKDLNHRNKHIKGLALEALAFYLMRLIDLTYIATRLRGQVTGGAEVDLIFEGTRFIFSRWQIQCKNTRTVSLDDVAKEVGLTHQLKSNVIMVVSTGSIGEEARKFAHHVMGGDKGEGETPYKIQKASCINLNNLSKVWGLEGIDYEKLSPTRKECACTRSIDIGAYDTCPHGCIYCYANTDKEKAMVFYRTFNSNRDALANDSIHQT